MSTTQKRGFRLPWSSDPTPDEGAEDAQRLGELLESVADSGKAATSAGRRDPGEGPFRPAPAEPADGVDQVAAEAAEGESEAVVLESVVGDRAGEPGEMEAAGSSEPVKDGSALAWPTTDRADPPAEATAQEDAQPAAEQPPAQQPPAQQPAAEQLAAREVAEVAHVAEPAPSTPRRDNPLVAGLVKAMREAAETSRDETIASLHAEATTQVEAIRSGATDEAAALRQRADDDVDEIHAWAKSETARIKQESEQRVVDRRDSLERELESHARDVDAQAAQVEDAVAGYEREMESFFEQLLAESDPARLATLAERAPAPPILSELPAVRRAAARLRDDTADPPKGATTAAEADTEGSGSGDEAFQATLEADDAVTAAPADETVTAAAADAAAEPLGPEAAAAAEAEAFEGLATTDGNDAIAPTDESDAGSRHEPTERGRQRVIVTGLATVAGISAFKSALGKIDGVQNVSVMAGDPGSFVFTIVHAPDLDLRAALPDLPGFETRITADDGGTVYVSAGEPAA